MDTTDPKIRFNSEGVCDHCETFYEQTLPRWRDKMSDRVKLEHFIEQIKFEGNGKEFDCILGLSGGIDSSYLTHIVAKEWGLKPLIFHVDAGWNSDIAVNNIEKLVDKLNLDLFTEVIDWDEMKNLQVAFFKSGVQHIDAPQDHAFFAVMYKFASQYNIKNILTGGNLSTECVRNPVDWMYYQSDSKQLKDIFRVFNGEDLKNFPTTSVLWHKIWLPLFRGIKVSRPLDMVQYNKDTAMTILTEEYGWKPYPQKHFESRFTKFYESYWLPERFGIDVRRVQFSSLILTQQMSRSEAIEKLTKPSFDEKIIEEEKDFICSKLSISRDDLEDFFNLEKRSYKDYKNSSNVYKFGAYVMRILNKELGGKR